MRMETHTPHRTKRNRSLIVILLLAGIGVAAWLIWGLGNNEKPQPTQAENGQGEVAHQPSPAGNGEARPQPGHDETAGASEATSSDGQDEGPPNEQPDEQPEDQPQPLEQRDPHRKAYGPEGMTAALAEQIGPSPITTAPPDAEAAKQAARKGLELYAKDEDILQARKLLNQAYLAYTAGKLDEEQIAPVREALEKIAASTILRRAPLVNPNDPYMLSYRFGAGESLLSRRKNGVVVKEGIIAREDLNVPWRIITILNGFGEDSTRFRAGKSYKLVKGPFHVVVYKSQRVADIFLQDLFLQRIPVGIGAPETPTPEGYFRVVQNGKTKNSTYYPPAETGRPNLAIYPGDPGYPLDKEGHNIKLEGIRPLGTDILASQSYAMHGTSEPESIGKAASRGCIRLRDEDARLLFSALQDYADPDDPRATWDRWSTITIRP